MIISKLLVRHVAMSRGSFLSNQSSRYMSKSIFNRQLLEAKWNDQAKAFRNAIKRFNGNDAGSAQQQARQQRIIGLWLASCAGLTFVTVTAGGLTRLTESGLSMVNWHLFKEVPPTNQQQWEEEFERYKQYPEFKVKNKDITLEQFKFIWHMEYGHRSLGRAIGAIFFLPAAFFWSKGWFNKGLKVRTVIFGSLLGCQGLLGWYMVKSGLETKEVYTHEPRVSQYRLAAHLGTAMVFYSLLFWNSLTLLVPPPSNLPAITPELLKYKKLVMSCKTAIFFTALSGAFVAGMDAGLVYNTWPKMADRWIPSDICRLSPKWRNMFENATTVQFNHRHLGEFTGALVLAAYAYSFKCNLPRRARIASTLLMAAIIVQITLGVTTLLNFVPISLASAHQSGALTTLSIALWLSNELKWVKRIPK